MTKIVYSFGLDGVFCGPLELTEADLSPLQEGVYLIPAGCTDVPPPQTDEQHLAVWRGAQWEVQPAAVTPPPAPPTLAQLKATKNDEINAARLAANFSHFEHAGKQIACDQLSRSDIDGTNGFVALYGALPPGWPGGWKAIDNTYVAIADVAAWKAFYASMFAAGNANFARAQTLKDALAAADTAAEVAAIQWGMEVP